jgi:hypothetical protein
MRFKVSLSETLTNQFQEQITRMTQERVRGAQAIARDVAIQAHEKARELASDRLKSTKMKYLNALSFDEEDGRIYTITLDGSAGHLEGGYPSFDMKAGLLASQAIVKTGKRAGQPWVRVSKEGKKYAAVPFNQTESLAKGGDLAMDLKALKQAFNVPKQIVGPSGQPIQGAVARMTKSKDGPQWTFRDVLGNHMTKSVEANPMLSGLTKIQYQTPKRGGGVVDKNAYMTWRMVSEKSQGWIHPGFAGAHVFPDLERWINDTLTQRLREYFSQGG